MPIHVAACRGHAHVLELLLAEACGGDANITTAARAPRALQPHEQPDGAAAEGKMPPCEGA